MNTTLNHCTSCFEPPGLHSRIYDPRKPRNLREICGTKPCALLCSQLSRFLTPPPVAERTQHGVSYAVDSWRWSGVVCRTHRAHDVDEVGNLSKVELLRWPRNEEGWN